MGKWCHVCEDGTVDWTSDVEQEGLVYLDLPSVNYGESCVFVNCLSASEGDEAVSSPDIDWGFSDALNCSVGYDGFHYVLDAATRYLLGNCCGEGHPISTEDVTVLIPCYKKATWIRETLLCVLVQTVVPNSIIVMLMDEESQALKDSLEAMSPSVRCVLHERLGICAARNYLVSLCETEYFAFLDADDIVCLTYFEKCLSNGADFIFSFPSESHNGYYCKGDLKMPFFGDLAGVFKKSAFLALGGLDEEFEQWRACADVDFILNVLASGRSFRLADGAIYYMRRDFMSRKWVQSCQIVDESRDFLRWDAVMRLFFKNRAFLSDCLEKCVLFDDSLLVLLREFLETGDKAYFLWLNFLIVQGLCPLDKWYASFKDLNLLSFFGIEMLYRGDCRVFDGSYEGWKFVNCEPSEEDKAFIAERVKGYSFDVLFLEDCFRDSFTFGALLGAKGCALVNADLPVDSVSGIGFFADLLKRFFCACLPVYKASHVEPCFHALDRSMLRGFYDMMQFIKPFGEDESLVLANSLDSISLPVIASTPLGEDIVFPQSVNFQLSLDCDRACRYCFQLGLRDSRPSLSDEEIYRRFDLCFSKIESLLQDVKFGVGFLGGEPTLWSDWLVTRLLERVGDRGVLVYSNNMGKNSLWRSSSSVTFLYHIVDWQGAGRLEEPSSRTLYMIVLCHDDMEYLEAFMAANEGINIDIIPYVGGDPALMLTEEDRRALAELERRYSDVCFKNYCEDVYFTGLNNAERSDLCLKQGKYYWQVDCINMSITPCCGVLDGYVPYEDFKGESPSLEDCRSCIHKRFILWAAPFPS